MAEAAKIQPKVAPQNRATRGNTNSDAAVPFLACAGAADFRVEPAITLKSKSSGRVVPKYQSLEVVHPRGVEPPTC